MSIGLIVFAWGLEVLVGWPGWLYVRIRHPVVWLGAFISYLEKAFNRQVWPHKVRYALGCVTSLAVVGAVCALGILIAAFARESAIGVVGEVILISSLLASRSLYDHVVAVARPLAKNDVQSARTAVSHIVGRDPNQLDEAGIARSAIESLAENASDGVTAPLFWGVVFGLPGIAAYKAINTLDSMIGHKNDRFKAFGGFAARLDDLANIIPSRLTALFVVAVRFRRKAVMIILRDARRHRSPNAGWPEAAMAAVLGVRLSGPRRYGQTFANEPWLNADAPDPSSDHIFEALSVYRNAMGLMAVILVSLVVWKMI